MRVTLGALLLLGCVPLAAVGQPQDPPKKDAPKREKALESKDDGMRFGEAAWKRVAPAAEKLFKEKGIYGTHHVGASTAQAQDAIARETVRIVAAYVRTGQVPNCVNVARQTPARARLVVRHVDKVGVLANVLGLVREAGINAETVQNTVFEDARAASCAIELDERPSEELLARIRARTDEILFVDCFEL